MAVFTTAAVAGVLGVASTSFLASVSAFALNAAVGIGLSMAAQALTKADQPQVAGVRGKMQSGGDVPRSFLMGTRATAGSLIYANMWGKVKKTPNAYLTQVIQLSDVPISGVTAMWVNGQPVTVNTGNTSYGDWGFPVDEYLTDSGGNHLWVKFYDGTQTEADPFLVGTVSSDKRPYEATRVGRGCAYAIVTSQANPQLFSGFPSFRFEVAGMPLYDPSKDSTVGGVGAHRWNDRATWGGDGDNLPAVQVYNLLRGISYDGAWLYGLQTLPSARLPTADWIAQINKCRTLVTGPDGLEAQYLTGIEISVDTELSASIDAILKGAHGRLIEVGGIYKLLIGAPSVAVLTFSDLDILSTETQRGKPFASLANSINGVTASYPEPMEAWNTKPAPPLYNAGYEHRDGQRRLVVDLPLETVSRTSQVQRIMAAALAEARRERRHTFTLPPFAWPVEPGDVVAWSSERNGYIGKQFRVEGVGDKANLDVMIDVVEVDPTDYDFGGTYVPPTFSPLDPLRPDPSVIDGWSAEPWTITDGSGAGRRPAIKVHAADDLNDVLSVHIVARVKLTGAVVFDSSATPYADPFEWVISGNWCLSATEYQVKGKEVPYSGRETEWSEWLSVITPDIRVTLEDLSQDIIDKLDELQEWIDDDLLSKVNQTIIDLNAAVEQIDQEEQDRIDGAIEAADRYRGLLNEIESIRDYVANADYAGYQAREEIRRTITARLEDSIATFDERITTAVSDTAAISERLTTFDAQVGDLGAQLITVDTARVDGDTALAQQIALLSAGTDNQFDPAKLWSFDSTVESWTGNGTPTVSGGFLRPANHASDPYVTSPIDLAVVANAYSQIRGRVRKTGAPTWDGRAWWREVSDSTWDTGRSATVSAPSFEANGIGLITFNMGWTGTIDQIRLDLSTAQDASNYFTIDWISIGSPSPGASRAELIAERTARIDGDGALASDVVALQAEITDPVTGLTAIAGSVSALESTVDTIGDTVTAHSTALTGVNAELLEKADVDVVEELQAEVEALGGGGIVSQGSAVTAIRNSLLPLASEIVDQEFANFLSKMQGLKVTAEASNSLDTKITLTAESLDILSQAVTRVQAVIPGLATSTALTALTARVTATESTLVSQASSITSINVVLPLKANTADVDTALATKASASGLTALTVRVSQTEDDIESQADAITTINSTLGTKASVAALSALTTRVSTAEGDIDAQGDLISSLTTTVGTKASATALTALTTRVTAAEDGLATKASAASVTALTVIVGENSADARFKMEVVAGPSGYARIGARVRYGTSGSYRAAGWYTDVPSDTEEDTLFVVEADRFAFVDGSTRMVPFRIDDGTVYIDDLKVVTSNIDPGAVTVIEYGTAANGNFSGNKDATVTINHGNRSLIPNLNVRVDVNVAYKATGDDAGVPPGVVTVTDVTGSDTLANFAAYPPDINRQIPISFSLIFTPPTGRTSTQFRFRLSSSLGNATGMNIIATAFKN